jgi:hypothetical protein
VDPNALGAPTQLAAVVGEAPSVTVLVHHHEVAGLVLVTANNGHPPGCLDLDLTSPDLDADHQTPLSLPWAVAPRCVLARPDHSLDLVLREATVAKGLPQLVLWLQKTLGEVVKVNRVKVKVKQLDTRGTYKSYPVGTIWTVPLSLLTKVDSSGQPVVEAPKPKRPEAEILAEIQGIYCRLSPENLSCDGEASLTHMRRMSAHLNRRLRECFQELGRRVSEDEAYRVAS